MEKMSKQPGDTLTMFKNTSAQIASLVMIDSPCIAYGQDITSRSQYMILGMRGKPSNTFRS
jgi:hypothetical protein